jgi:hypothetical protein
MDGEDPPPRQHDDIERRIARQGIMLVSHRASNRILVAAGRRCMESLHRAGYNHPMHPSITVLSRSPRSHLQRYECSILSTHCQCVVRK